MGQPGERGMSATIHSFQASLEKAAQTSAEHWWLELYRRAFPNVAAIVEVRKDGWAQRAGIDRVLTLADGRTITIDEKVRKEAWPDFALERWSDEKRRVPGWMQKPLACDFIAYIYVPTKTCYLLPYLPLRLAWLAHGREWVEKYREVRANNDGYVTVSVAVPRDVVLAAMTEAMRISWGGAA